MKITKVAVREEIPAVAGKPSQVQWLISIFLPVYVVLYRECQLYDPKAHKIYS